MKGKDITMRGPAHYSQEGTPVAIFFEDPTISVVFARLLQAMGVEIQLLNEIAEADENTKVITEPQFFPELKAEQRDTCLLIGNKEALRNIDALSISQPLTEEKVESGLATFLGVPLQ